MPKRFPQRGLLVPSTRPLPWLPASFFLVAAVGLLPRKTAHAETRIAAALTPKSEYDKPCTYPHPLQSGGEAIWP